MRDDIYIRHFPPYYAQADFSLFSIQGEGSIGHGIVRYPLSPTAGFKAMTPWWGTTINGKNHDGGSAK